MSSGIGRPKPHSSRIVNSHRYAPAAVRVDQVGDDPLHAGLPGGAGASQITQHSGGRRRAFAGPRPSPGRRPSHGHEVVGRALTLSPVERTVLPDEGVPNAQASCQLARRAAPLGVSALVLAVVAAAFAFSATGCKPDYPSCETDKDCHAERVLRQRQVPAVPRLERLPGGQRLQGRQVRGDPGLLPQQGRLPREPGMHRQQVQGLRERQGMPRRPALREGRLHGEEAVQDRQRLPAGRGLHQGLLQQGEGAGAAARAVHAGRRCSSTSTNRR